MLPLPEVTELHEMPPEFAGAFTPRRGRAVRPTALQQFKRLMAREGWPVQLARMHFDRPYAYDRIAQAHGSAHDPLRRVALELFQAYHHLDSAPRSAPAQAH